MGKNPRRATIQWSHLVRRCETSGIAQPTAESSCRLILPNFPTLLFENCFAKNVLPKMLPCFLANVVRYRMYCYRCLQLNIHDAAFSGPTKSSRLMLKLQLDPGKRWPKFADFLRMCPDFSPKSLIEILITCWICSGFSPG